MCHRNLKVAARSGFFKSRAILLHIYWLTLLFSAMVPGILNAQSVPLRPDRVESVISDLEDYIPREMFKAGTPGLAIALIRDHKLVWEKGFGLANTINRRPVESTTMFHVASLGKPIVSFAALKFVSEGSLKLDQPLDHYLDTPWLADTNDRALITLRHVLTHTSGLSNFLGDRTRRTKFTPGKQFSYSGIGFMYLQQVLEKLTRMPFDSVMIAGVLHPLGMRSTWFGTRFRIDGPVVHSHLKVSRAIIPVTIIFFPLAFLGFLLAACGVRIVLGTWNSPTWLYHTMIILAAIATILFLLDRASSPAMIPFFVAAFCVFVVVTWSIAMFIEFIFGRLRKQTGKIAFPFRIGLGIVVFAGLFFVIQDWRVPVYDILPKTANAASSMVSTVGDLGRFLIALDKPEGLSSDLALAFTQPQVSVSDHIGWGLGVGIQENGEGSALFHWGRNPSVRAAMIYYPSIGTGVVVLTNDGWAGDEVADIAIRAIGGPRFWADE